MENEVQLSPAQRTAADCDHTKPAIVTAAAGSGKTTLLVERVIRLLSDRELNIPADSIAVMTFTRNATKSMREKLNRALTEKINSLAESASVDDREQHDYLKRQMFALRQAAISTIDAFCLRVIKENAEAFELPLSFTIADGAKKAAMQSQAMRAAMQEFYGDEFTDEERAALFFSFSFEDDAALETAVLELSEKLSSCPDPDRWMNETLDVYKDIKSVEEHFLKYLGKYIEMCVRRAELSVKKYSVEEIYDRLNEEVAEKRANTKGKNISLDTMENDVLPSIQRYIEFDEKRIGKLSENYESYRKTPSIKSLSEMVKNLEDNSADPPDRYSRNGNTYQYKKLFNKTAKSVDEAAAKLLDIKVDYELEENTLPDILGAMKSFFRLVRIFSEFYRLEKTTSGCIDFSDCERELYSKLSENDGDNDFRRQLAQRFGCIIVDEFQDSNHIQSEIFRLLGENRLFYVGDVKQSIYSFRGADPYIMADLCDSPESPFEVLKLNTNYRSRIDVINTVNAAFSGIMTREFGGADYADNNGLNLGSDLPEPNNNELYNSELFLVTTAKTENAEGEKDKDMTLPRFTAKRIRELCDNEDFLIADGKDEKGEYKLRRAEYSDFIILLRTKSKTDCYRKALAELGIPSASAKGSDFFEADEVRMIYSFLKVIDDPLLDEDMLKVLMSPIYRFSAEEIAQLKMGVLGIGGLSDDKLRKIAASYKRRSLYSCIGDCMTQQSRLGKNKTDVHRNVSPKLARFFGDLRAFRYHMSSSPLDDLIRKIYEDTDLTAIVAAFEDSSGRVANIRRLQRMASDFEARDGGNLADFLRFLDRARENSAKGIEEAARPAVGANAVRIMTFHASKGLEAPVCIMSELQNGMNASDFSGNILADFTGGMAMAHVDVKHRRKSKTLPYRALSRFIRERQLGDELRLLYVAMTRAQEKLIMISSVSKDNFDKLNETVNGDPIDPEFHDAVYDTNVPFTCVMNSLLQYAPLINAETKQFALEGTGCRVTAVNSSEETEEAAEHAVKGRTPAEPEFAFTEEEAAFISRLINQKYAHIRDTEQQAKFTTTELAHRKSAKPISLTKPLFALGGAVSGVEKGNAYHHCMQHFPLHRVSTDMSDEDVLKAVREAIDEMERAHRITPDERRIVEDFRVAKFFTSGLGRRMLRALDKDPENVRREQSFYAEVNGSEVRQNYDGVISIQGQIDMYFIEDGEIVVVDYKSDTLENLAKEQQNYEFQVEIYTRILGKLTGMNVKEMYLYAFLADSEMKI